MKAFRVTTKLKVAAGKVMQESRKKLNYIMQCWECIYMTTDCKTDDRG